MKKSRSMILELKKDRITLYFWSVEQIFSVYKVDVSFLQYFDGHFLNKLRDDMSHIVSGGSAEVTVWI